MINQKELNMLEHHGAIEYFKETEFMRLVLRDKRVQEMREMGLTTQDALVTLETIHSPNYEVGEA